MSFSSPSIYQPGSILSSPSPLLELAAPPVDDWVFPELLPTTTPTIMAATTTIPTTRTKHRLTPRSATLIPQILRSSTTWATTAASSSTVILSDWTNVASRMGGPSWGVVPFASTSSPSVGLVDAIPPTAMAPIGATATAAGAAAPASWSDIVMTFSFLPSSSSLLSSATPPPPPPEQDARFILATRRSDGVDAGRPDPVFCLLFF
mmetsp:Transcript_31163/g.63312  ORF Transcript_31163/g.63312 Transcript_31163/m.63312 type:complete len:206 (+) Transcript_31163:472-1089(+)